MVCAAGSARSCQPSVVRNVATTSDMPATRPYDRNLLYRLFNRSPNHLTKMVANPGFVDLNSKQCEVCARYICSWITNGEAEPPTFAHAS